MKLYPPLIEGVLPAFYKRYSSNKVLKGAIIEIPFQLNRAVSSSEIKALSLQLRTIQQDVTNSVNNMVVNDVEGKVCDFFDISKGTASFSFSAKEAEEFNVGQFYKAQLAFIDQTDTVGYYSTVGIIKCVAKPTVSIANFSTATVNTYNNSFIGEYQQIVEEKDPTEKVYSYRFDIWDNNEKLIVSTGDLIHNTSEDLDAFSSRDIFNTNKYLPEGVVGYIQYSVVTLNALNISSPRYRVMRVPSIDMENEIEIIPELDFEEGLMRLQLKGKKLNSKGNEALYIGRYVILRGSYQTDYLEWDPIAYVKLNNQRPSSQEIIDYTIEQGVRYKYALQQYNEYGVYSNRIETDEVLADFEDMFLFDGKRQLKMRLNPKVNSFKANIPEQKQDTIGSRFPYIFRNGIVNYKEFPISGLISYQMDNHLHFLLDDEPDKGNVLVDDEHRSYLYKWYKKDEAPNIATSIHEDAQELAYKYRLEKINNDTELTEEEREEALAELEHWREQRKKVTPVVPWPEYENEQLYFSNGQIVRMDKNLTTENHQSERYFKLKVLDWLNDGKPKVFRSPGEGNYIVRLLNNSLAPNDTVGRMIHTSTSTAYEIAEYNYENLVKFGFISLDNSPLTEAHWGSCEVGHDLIDPYYNTNNENIDNMGFIEIPNLQKPIHNFFCEDFAPGDIIRIVFTNPVSIDEMVIGITGSYYYSNQDKVIDKILIKPIDRQVWLQDYINPEVSLHSHDYSRILVYQTTGFPRTWFDEIMAVKSQTMVAREFIGPKENVITEMNKYLNSEGKHEAIKYKLLNIEKLQVRPRILIPVFKTGEDTYSLTPFGTGELGYLNLYDICNHSEDSQYIHYDTNDILEQIVTNNEAYNLGQHTLDCIYEAGLQAGYLDKYCIFKCFEWDGEKWVDGTGDYKYYDPIRPTTNDYVPYFSTRNDIKDTNRNDVGLIEVKQEMEINNLGAIDYLYLGNGIIADITFQLQVVDWSVEETDEDTKNKKADYLQAKNQYATLLEKYSNGTATSTQVASRRKTITINQDNYAKRYIDAEEVAYKNKIERRYFP